MLREDKVICLGDVNINFLDTEAAPANYMLEMLDSTGIEQIVEEAITNTSATLIDVILCNDPLMIESKYVGGLDLTDHELISCKVLQDRQKIEPLFYTYRSFRSLEMDKLHADLQNLPLIDICYLSNIDEKVNLFNHLILTLFDKHIPLKTSKITKPKAPWLKDDIRNLMCSRDAARSKYRKNPNDSNWNAYKKLKNKTNHAILHEKRKYFDKIAQKMNPTTKINIVSNIYIRLRNTGITTQTNLTSNEETHNEALYCVTKILEDMFINVVEKAEQLTLTKDGRPRKRKRFIESDEERKEKRSYVNGSRLLPPCSREVVEKKKGKVYDFGDYVDAVKTFFKGINVVVMNEQSFYSWEDHTSQYKLNKITPRPYLKSMVEVHFTREERTI
ncbi:unnamed protein product [Acanthoscelides obtectus]|uniref:Endonuclease/exonuclease/phosphatase domain-containing protein n=1 Tax=Acanthoscelides obtectus TaxID=200917 RepID=A0A9P0LU04_ACAOB|nr:unnamed protein product [Acanthoscelides obtectus]CAK1677923.1 hypothetical protein AOBTE_LOCUS31651 [Acanthoscelides obtectus]